MWGLCDHFLLFARRKLEMKVTFSQPLPSVCHWDDYCKQNKPSFIVLCGYTCELRGLPSAVVTFTFGSAISFLSFRCYEKQLFRVSTMLCHHPSSHFCWPTTRKTFQTDKKKVEAFNFILFFRHQIQSKLVVTRFSCLYWQIYRRDKRS